MKDFIRPFILLSLTLATSACTFHSELSENDLIGNWIEMTPEDFPLDIKQGMQLHDQGTASSIGMATLIYENWQLQNGHRIILSGKSIGNGQTISFKDTLSIISLHNDTLTLGNGTDHRIRYIREADSPEPIGHSDAAMGYIYSDVLKRKIRIFEEGYRVRSATDSTATLAGYVILTPDSSEAELFLPENKIMLRKSQHPDGHVVWNSDNNDTYLLEKTDTDWLISRRGQLLYATNGTTDALHVSFDTDQDTTADIVFYQASGAAQLSINGQKALLIQYPTASGYGYANQDFDLRGKGKEAQLTCLTDGKVCHLKEKE